MVRSPTDEFTTKTDYYHISVCNEVDTRYINNIRNSMPPADTTWGTWPFFNRIQPQPLLPHRVARS